ncbi:MAG: DUF3108 domain-containing protein [Paludibacter sp.]
MKIHRYFLFIVLIYALSVNAQEVINPPVKSDTAFIAGENLTFQIRYGFITAGTTQLSLTDTVYQNKLVLHSYTIAQTTGLADKIYGVKDVYESWFDKETNLPYKQISNIQEGHYTKYNEVTYNRRNNTIHSKLSGIHDVPKKILDLSSVLYYIRRIDFSKVIAGDTILLNLYFSDEVFPFRFIYKGKETIRTRFGKISCLKISPVVEVGRIFKKKDDLTIWLTDDGNRIPVLIRMDIRIVGLVNLKLVSFNNICNPLIFNK